MRHVQGVIDRLGLLQIDSVNVLARAHLLPLFSRLGPYDTGLLDRATASGRYARRAGKGATADRRLVESWAHVAAYVPPARGRCWPSGAAGSLRSTTGASWTAYACRTPRRSARSGT